jgi:hypothetical protein
MYNASAVKIHNATSSLALFENKKSPTMKKARLLQSWCCSCLFVGLAPGLKS